MGRLVTPFLMFQGQAEEAITFYVDVIPDSEVLSLQRWGKGEAGREGTVRMAHVRLGDQIVMCNDSPPVHAFTFTPSLSLFVSCRSEAEFDDITTRLAEGGAFLMQPGNYGFSARFAWANDRFGVSWQVNLEA